MSDHMGSCNEYPENERTVQPVESSSDGRAFFSHLLELFPRGETRGFYNGNPVNILVANDVVVIIYGLDPNAQDFISFGITHDGGVTCIPRIQITGNGNGKEFEGVLIGHEALNRIKQIIKGFVQKN